MQHTASFRTNGFADQPSAGADGALSFVAAIPMQHADAVTVECDDGHRLGLGNSGQQQLGDPQIEISFRAGVGNDLRKMREHFDAFVGITELDVLQLTGFVAEFFEHAIVLWRVLSTAAHDPEDR